MAGMTVNGKRVEIQDEGRKLISLLREDLRLTSVKEGCGEGACGSCMVLVDGKKARACLLRLGKVIGKSVLTVEGLSRREKDVYAHCFAEAGAVQCGFCMPGMVISAKALLDAVPDPSRAEVKAALKGNICRCTGYVKIEEAILEAARFFREHSPLPGRESRAGVDMRFRRVDAEAKVLGEGIFADDVVLPGMIYGKALRSRYPRARVNRIDASRAAAHPDCVRILTAADVPFNKTGHILPDWDVLIAEGDITRYMGDAIVLAATNRPESLDEVLALVEVDYSELSPVTSAMDALRGDAPLIHPETAAMGNVLHRETLKRGDADAAIRRSAHVVTRKYKIPFADHAFMEPECAIAVPEGEDGLLVYSAAQSVYDEQREIARMLRIAPEKVHCRSMLVGGAFGGKEDMSVQHHAALLAWHVKRPVKVKFSRQESLVCHTKRHAMDMEFTTACDEEGRLTAMKALIVADTGAYASLGGPVLQRACTHAGGPYAYRNIDILGLAVYTNNVVGGAYRGFGVTQSCFAVENNISLLAEAAGISAWEIRRINAVRPGQTLPNGQIVSEDCALAECLDAVKEAYESHPRAGIACAFKNCGTGVGTGDTGRCLLSVEGGRLHVRSSAACMGQGVATMCLQMVCEASGLDPALLLHEAADTLRTPDAGTSTASRQTLLTGEAARRAALKLRADLDGGKTLEDLEGREYHGEFSALTDPMGSPLPNPVSHISYGYGAQVVQLAPDGRVEKIVGAFDVGTPVNLQSVQGQIEGGTVMGLGLAFTENFPLEQGRVKARYATLGLWRAPDVPEIEVRLVRAPGEQSPCAYGAKGIGELCHIPTAPACSHAYYRLDGRLRSALPMKDSYYSK